MQYARPRESVEPQEELGDDEIEPMPKKRPSKLNPTAPSRKQLQFGRRSSGMATKVRLQTFAHFDQSEVDVVLTL